MNPAVAVQVTVAPEQIIKSFDATPEFSVTVNVPAGTGLNVITKLLNVFRQPAALVTSTVIMAPFVNEELL